MTDDGASTPRPGTLRTEFLILAAGTGTRFRPQGGEGHVCGVTARSLDADKLTIPVAGSSLPQHAVEFAVHNGAERVHVTVADSSYGDRVRADVEATAARLGIDVVSRRQESSVYGTAAALLPWSGLLETPIMLLFGDNFYHGVLPELADAGALYFTYSDASDFSGLDPASGKDLHQRYAAVIGDRIVEKPHVHVDGPFFTGLLRLPAGFLNTFHPSASRRGELEITEAANAWARRIAIRLAETDVVWGDITYQEDLPALVTLVEGTRR